MRTFTVLGGLILRTGSCTGSLTGSLEGSDPSEVNLISSCLSTDEEIEVDESFFPKDALTSFSNSSLSEFHEFDEYLANNFNLHKSGQHLISTISESDPDEAEGKDYIQSIVDGWAGEDISTICDELSIEEYDLYESVFVYTGWEAGRVFADTIEDEGEGCIDLEIEVLFSFDCDLDTDSIVEKLEVLSESKVTEEASIALTSLIINIKQGWFPACEK